MRIVFWGNFIVDYCSEVHHAKSLEALGHEVIRMQETVATSDQVLAEALKSDMLVWVHSHSPDFDKITKPMNEVHAALNAKNIPIVAYHLDLYMPLTERWGDYVKHPYFNDLDYFFATDKLMCDWFNENTSVKGRYIPAGVYDKECIPAHDKEKSGIIFAGSKGYHPEWPYRPKLINWLAETYPAQFTHVGGDGIGTVRGGALTEMYHNAKVVVGDSLVLNFDYPYYWSDRVYETLGRGGFLIMPYIKGLDEEFEDGKHLVFYEFNDFAQLKSTIDFYMANDEAREYIRRQGQKHVMDNYTYRHRWEYILKEVFDGKMPK